MNQKTSDSFEVDFIGIGAFKSATSWVAQCLREHPEVCVPTIKEIDFFSKTIQDGRVAYWNYEKGMGWYEKQFSECSSGNLKGEYSNSYLYDESAPRLVKKHFPDVKLIVCLRNPIDRAYSHFWWSKLNFNRHQKESFSDLAHKGTEYVEKSLYYRYLSRYFELFEREQIHVILVDDIVKNPRGVIRDLYEFLGVDSSFSPPSLLRKVNPAGKARFELLVYLFRLRVVLEEHGLGVLIDLLKKLRLYNLIQNIYVGINREKANYPPLAEAERERLRKIFADDIKNLEKLLDLDLSFWK